MHICFNSSKHPEAGDALRITGVLMTMREESNVKKQGNVKAKTKCKLDHLKNLAVWVAAEADVLPFGAFFGEHLAATSESLGLRADPSLFVCERCESILQPGHNCTVRIEANKIVRRRRKKPNPVPQNNIVYKCHFCCHQNLMRGTPKGYMKEICPSKSKPASKSKIANSAVKKHLTLHKSTAANLEVGFVALPALDGQNLETNALATPMATPGLSLLDSKQRKRTRPGVKKVAEHEASSEAEKSVHVSSKRRKKVWTSLKEISVSNARHTGNKLTNSAVPFFI